MSTESAPTQAIARLLEAWRGEVEARAVYTIVAGRTTVRTRDGWVPSLGYLKAEDVGEASARIDDAARAAGRDPSAVRRVLNVGADLSAEDFAGLALEHGFDIFITSPDAGDAFIQEVVPRVRELVADARGSG